MSALAVFDDHRSPHWKVYQEWKSQSDARPRYHDGTAWDASSWLSVGSDLTLAAHWAPPGAGNLRIGSIAVNTMLAGCTGSFASILYMWIRFGKPDASMTGNGLLAGLVAITAPSGFVNTVGAVIIGFAAGMIVCLEC